MASIDRRAANVVNATLLPSPGPYLARIVSNIDPMKQGALDVELLRPIGNQKDAGQQLFTVRYLSPFYGVTPLECTGTDQTEFNDTQKSYGFWAVPPDVGVTVMVIFVDGDPGQGFWIGCVQDALMNHMIPGIAASTAFQDKVRANTDIEWGEVEETKKRYGEEVKLLPVGEVNRRVFKDGGNNAPTPNTNVEANKKPVHPIAERLFAQGLEKDEARGTTTSSARRESPSNVYGWSTPGPVDKRKGAKKGKIGKINDKIDKFVSRMGGHQFIMDDGDDRFLRKTRPWEGPPEYANLENNEEGLVDFPMDEQIRIRTRKGAQILMHSSEDLIYICNSRGTAWMEFTSEGRVQIYAKEGVHFSSGGDLNFTARRDVNYTVNRNYNRQVAANSNEHTQGAKTVRVAGSSFHEAGGDIAMNSNNNMYMQASFSSEHRAQQVNMSGSSFEWAVGGSLIIDCSGNNFEVRAANVVLTGTNETHISAESSLKLFGRSVDVHAGKGELSMYAAQKVFLRSDGNLYTEAAATHSSYAGEAMKLTSKAAMSVGSSGDAIKMTAGKAINLGAQGDIVQKGTNIHLNGPDPEGADIAAKDINMAKEALPAHGASGAAGTATAGGGTEFAHTLVGFTTDAGWSLDKVVPTAEPSAHSNHNPERFHPANTDQLNHKVITSSNKTLSIRRNNDHNEVDTAEGGFKSGILAASYKFGAENLPNVGKARTTRPLTKDYLISHPMDWTKDSEFLQKAGQVAGSFGVSREELLAVISIATDRTMAPDKPSPGDSRIGLVQMGDSEAKMAGTTTAKLKHMSRAEQMDYVQKFLNKVGKGQINDAGSLFLAVHDASKVGIPENQEVYKKGTKLYHHYPNFHEGEINGKLTKKGIANAVKMEAEWIKSALGTGQNSQAKQARQGPQSSGSTSAPQNARSPGTPSGLTASPSYNPGSSGTNVPYWRNRDGSTNT